MEISSFYPVILTDQVAATAAFYTEHFGFEKVFEMDWYVSLKMSTTSRSSWPFSIRLIRLFPKRIERK